MSTKSSKPTKGIVRFGDNNKKKHGNKTELDSRDKIGGNKVNNNKFEENKVTKEKNYQKTFIFKKSIRSSDFLFLGARLAFIKLK